MSPPSNPDEPSKVQEFKDRIVTAKRHLLLVSNKPKTPGHVIWAAQAEVDRLEREYARYLELFSAPDR